MDSILERARRASASQVHAEGRELAEAGNRLTLALSAVLESLADWPMPLYVDEAAPDAQARAADLVLDAAEDFIGDVTGAHCRRAGDAGIPATVIGFAELRERAERLGRQA